MVSYTLSISILKYSYYTLSGLIHTEGTADIVTILSVVSYTLSISILKCSYYTLSGLIHTEGTTDIDT